MKTILIVEDQKETLDIHSRLLTHHGYRVLGAVNGEEGVRSARENSPDLILMDVSVPRLDGIDATRLIKQDSRTEHIPVIIVSAHPYGSVGRRAQLAGCDGFINKPCEPNRLLNEVQQRIGPADETLH